MAAAETTESTAREFLTDIGPKPGVKYPVDIRYCGGENITYCEYYPGYERCKKWLEDNLPKEFEKLMSGKGGGDIEEEKDGEDKKKRQTRGGKGAVKAKKKLEPEGIKLATSTRGKKKKITIVTGLASYEIDLKAASKFFSNKFSCGSSISGDDEIVIQGDVKDDLFDILPEKWSIIDEESIEDLGELKK
ncbi:hypothetical protein ACJMK2_011233 [Sinanodonta woodiana]|uniref:SUI1 domain-containing protein n=1 Tax=Sinanodonta woodiana TaxID=1069815 RepID=A0ABD3V5P8_SINWO